MWTRVAAIVVIGAAAVIAGLLGARSDSESPGSHDASILRGSIVIAEDTIAGSEIHLVTAEDFARGKLNNAPLYVESAGGEFRSPVRVMSFLWSPDARSFMYLVRRSEGKYPNYEWRTELWMMNIDGTGRTMLEGDVDSDRFNSECGYFLPALVDWYGYDADYRWVRSPKCDEHPASPSPDRRRVVFRAYGIDSSTLCLTNARAERRWGAGCSGDGFFSEPAWSPR
jgi:hypothetical protein